jgi:tetratricopeptide (TPR) repeat protein
MSEVWARLLSIVSGHLLFGDVLLLAAVAGVVAIGLVLCAVLLLRRGRASARARQITHAAPPAPAGPPEAALPTRLQLLAREYPAPARAAASNPLRTPGDWRVLSGPLTGSRVVVGATTAPLAPAGTVAVAERDSEPLHISAATELWTPPTSELVSERSSALDASAPAGEAEALAKAEYRRGLQLLAHADSDRARALHEALACFRRAQDVWTRDSAPERWAAIQNDIGRAYQEIPDGDRAAHLRTAIMHHQSALEVFDPVQHALNWAWTQSALGAAYQSLPAGSAIANARAAVAYHQRALDVLTRENAALAWAWNQNNLGAAYETMRGGVEGERVAHLHDAARCYAAALEVYAAETFPVQHQVVARNLTRVQSELKALE